MKVVLVANTDWYLYNFRLPLARRLAARGDEVVLASPPGPWSARFAGEGLRWRPVALARRSVNPLLELRAILSLRRIYREERPGLVHHFTLKCAIHGSLAARLAGVPAVVNALTGMGTVFASPAPAMRFLRPLVRFLLRLALARGVTIFQNPEDRDEFVREGLVDAAQARVVLGSGVDVDRFRPRATPAGAPPCVILVARLLREKGIETFVEAARRVRARRPEARFLAVGEGDPGNPASIEAAQVEAWRREGNVEFPGHREDVAELLREADVFVLPTFYREGVPRSLIEAAASGLPLVASDVRGCREVVEEGGNGFLVAPKDAHALAAAIERILGDGALRARMAARSRAIACERFAESAVLERTLEAYGEATA